jgi:hypothetical protein
VHDLSFSFPLAPPPIIFDNPPENVPSLLTLASTTNRSSLRNPTRQSKSLVSPPHSIALLVLLFTVVASFFLLLLLLLSMFVLLFSARFLELNMHLFPFKFLNLSDTLAVTSTFSLCAQSKFSIRSKLMTRWLLSDPEERLSRCRRISSSESFFFSSSLKVVPAKTPKRVVDVVDVSILAAVVVKNGSKALLCRSCCRAGTNASSSFPVIIVKA